MTYHLSFVALRILDETDHSLPLSLISIRHDYCSIVSKIQLISNELEPRCVKLANCGSIPSIAARMLKLTLLWCQIQGPR